jgi:16S rRNA (cytosine1402-N4)-methyltransferase
MASLATFHHVPVLLTEVVSIFRARLLHHPSPTLLDCTVGGGGHARALLEALPNARLLGLDVDAAAVGAATAALAPFGARARVALSHWSAAPAALRAAGLPPAVHGLLADVGVSSHQLDTPARGFSFREDGPLDMRLNGRAGPTAADLLAALPEAALRDLLLRLGEEPAAAAIARAVAARREGGGPPLARTGDLAALVAAAAGRFYRGGSRRHPATRTFQALRVAVNGELDALQALMGAVPALLAPGGVAACISFHSLEDRIVKRAVKALCAARGWAPLGAPQPLVAGDAEVAANPRARSAKLRAVGREA